MQLHPRAKKHRCYLWTGLMLPWCIILIGGGIYHNSSAQVYEHTKGGRNETAPLGFLSVLPYSCPMTQPSAWHSFHSFLTHLLHSEASGVLWQGHETRHSRAYWTPSWSSLEVWCPVVHCCLALHTSVGYQLHNLSELNAPGPVFSLFKFTFIKAMEYIPRIFMYFFFKKQENKKTQKKNNAHSQKPYIYNIQIKWVQSFYYYWQTNSKLFTPKCKALEIVFFEMNTSKRWYDLQKGDENLNEARVWRRPHPRFTDKTT